MTTQEAAKGSTPGPWTVEVDAAEVAQSDDVLVESEFGMVARVYGGKNDAESAANAALIAAAPALAAENARLREALQEIADSPSKVSGEPDSDTQYGYDMGRKACARIAAGALAALDKAPTALATGKEG